MTAETDLVRRRISANIDTQQKLLDSDAVELTARAAELITQALSLGHKAIFFGNGGSSMDAGHLAAELLGRFYYDRPALPAVSLPDCTAAVTAIGNDYGYEQVFARQLRGLGSPGDVAVGLTTSGNSINVLHAFEAARERGLSTIALTGEGGGLIHDLVDVCISVPTTDTPRVQEACMLLGHTICEMVEQSLHPR